MNSAAEQIFSDHPRPTNTLRVLLGLFFLAGIAGMGAILLTNAFPGYQGLIIGPLLILESIILYAFWLIANVSYRVSPAGISVKFGSLITDYGWDDFQEASLKEGFFFTGIGWQGIPPIVRFRDTVMLSRTDLHPPLILTPTEPVKFLEIIGEIRPRLIKEQV